MANYEIHPYCAAWPNLPDDELKEMADNIARRGQDQPIYVFRKQIIDGKNRLAACKLAGVQPKYEQWCPTEPQDDEKTDQEIKDLTIALNIRRQMTTGQRAIVAAELSHRKRGGEQCRNSDNGPSQGEAAKSLKVSRESVNTAAQVLAHGSPALIESVRSGTVTPHDAAQIVDLPKREQNSAVKDVAAGRAPTVAKAVQQKAAPQESIDIDNAIGRMLALLRRGRTVPDELQAAFDAKGKACPGFTTRAVGYGALRKGLADSFDSLIGLVESLEKKWGGCKNEVDSPPPAPRSVTTLKR